MAKSKGANLQQAMPSITSDVATQTEQDPLDHFEVKDHLDTLMRAHKIMNDKTKMAKVHALAGRHRAAIRSIQDIKNHYNIKYGPKKKVDLASLNPIEDMEGSGDGGGTE